MYELRTLKAKDIFAMSKILSKIGITELKSVANSPAVANMTRDGMSDDAFSTQVGIAIVFEIADVILRNLGSCESEMYAFLADLSGMTPADVEDMDMASFVAMVVEVVKKEEFVDFIKGVRKLF